MDMLFLVAYTAGAQMLLHSRQFLCLQRTCVQLCQHAVICAQAGLKHL